MVAPLQEELRESLLRAESRGKPPQVGAREGAERCVPQPAEQARLLVGQLEALELAPVEGRDPRVPAAAPEVRVGQIEGAPRPVLGVVSGAQRQDEVLGLADADLQDLTALS